MLMTHAVMAAAALLGLANAAVFTAIMMGRLGMDSPFARNICRLDAGDCRKVVSSPRARLAGIPNSVVGVAWYLWAGSSAAAAMRTGALPFYMATLVAAVASAAVSLFLLWTLRFRLRVHCGFCYMGHLVNFVILGCVLLAG